MTKIYSDKNYLDLNELHYGNTPEVMRNIEPNSVALSFWSPPYFVGKNYEKDATFESWQELLNETITAHKEILKPGGFLVINIDDILAFPDKNMPKIQAPNKSKLRCKVTKEDILELKKEFPELNRNQLAKKLDCSEQTIDRRLNGNNIRGGKYNVQTRVFLVGHYLEKYAYENDLYLYDRRIWAKDPAWQNSQWHSNSYRAVSEFEHLYFFWKPGETIIDRNRLKASEWAEWASRGIWNIPSVRANREHEAQFPVALAKRVIRLLTEEGDIVLDPFMGSGTTALACIQEKRKYIGIDNQKEYIKLAKQRIEKEKESLFN